MRSKWSTAVWVGLLVFIGVIYGAYKMKGKPQPGEAPPAEELKNAPGPQPFNVVGGGSSQTNEEETSPVPPVTGGGNQGGNDIHEAPRPISGGNGNNDTGGPNGGGPGTNLHDGFAPTSPSHP